MKAGHRSGALFPERAGNDLIRECPGFWGKADIVLASQNVCLWPKADIGFCEHPTYSFTRRPRHQFLNGAPGLERAWIGQVSGTRYFSDVSKNVPKVW